MNLAEASKSMIHGNAKSSSFGGSSRLGNSLEDLRKGAPPF